MHRCFHPLAALALSLGACALGAQSYEPERGASPLTLLAAPPDAQAYHARRTRVLALVAEGKGAEAEPLAERLTREYPRDGENWILLGRARRLTGRHAEAAEAFERAGPLLGWGVPYNVSLNAAVARLAAGDRRGALDLLRRETFEHLTTPQGHFHAVPGLAALRDDPEFREIVRRPDASGWSRDEGRLRDLEHLVSEVQRVDPDYRDRPLPAEFTRRYEALRRELPRLSEEALFVGMSRMLATLRQGHVELYPPATGRQLPLQLYAFLEGVYVVDATTEHAGLVGSRVLTIGSTSVEEALRRVNATQSVDGDMQYLWLGPWLLRQSYFLEGLGIVAASDSVTLGLESRAGARRTVTAATTPVGPRPKLVAPPAVPPPLFLRDVAQAHWEQPLPEHDALYVQLNQMRDDRDESLPAFGRRMWDVIVERKPTSVIVDVRHNNGGSNTLHTELLRTLIGFTRTPGHRLYVLMGRGSFSSTALLLNDLERLADPILVGEASSECCYFNGDPTGLLLPYSKLAGELTAVRWGTGRAGTYDRRREMSPHLPVQLTARAYFAGEDPVLQAALTHLASMRRRPSPPGR